MQNIDKYVTYEDEVVKLVEDGVNSFGLEKEDAYRLCAMKALEDETYDGNLAMEPLLKLYLGKHTKSAEDLLESVFEALEEEFVSDDDSLIGKVHHDINNENLYLA